MLRIVCGVCKFKLFDNAALAPARSGRVYAERVHLDFGTRISAEPRPVLNKHNFFPVPCSRQRRAHARKTAARHENVAFDGELLHGFAVVYEASPESFFGLPQNFSDSLCRRRRRRAHNQTVPQHRRRGHEIPAFYSHFYIPIEFDVADAARRFSKSFTANSAFVKTLYGANLS